MSSPATINIARLLHAIDCEKVFTMDREKRMAEIHSNFSEQAKDYDDQVRKIVPRYDEMLDALVSCIGPREDRDQGH